MYEITKTYLSCFVPRKKYLELTALNRWRMDVRHYTISLVKVGKIIKKPCQVCGAIKAEMHHDNYTQPSQVTFLCWQHHSERHRLMNQCPITEVINQLDKKFIENLVIRHRLIQDFKNEVLKSDLGVWMRKRILSGVPKRLSRIHT